MNGQDEKFVSDLDGEQLKSIYSDKMQLIDELKDRALFLASAYRNCIKIEIDVNPAMKSCKLSVREYL